MDSSGLKGALLMCIGMINDNMHFQEIVCLLQRLIELEKKLKTGSFPGGSA
ncbi:MAG: hypothetical protein Q8N05_14715 [Bacteroidota bacterium]|nr:hypothetical protein [Bacteroidota bacterium]